MSGTSDGGTVEHVLVATAAPSHGPEARQHEPPRAVEAEDLFRLRDFERIPAQPVDPVVQYRHATAAPVLPVPLERISAPCKIRRQPPEHPIRDDGGGDGGAPPRALAIEALETGPAPRPRALVIVDRDREMSVGAE